MIDTRLYFDNVNKPKYLSCEEKKFGVNVQIQKQRIKLYVTRELVMKSNLKKIHGLIW